MKMLRKTKVNYAVCIAMAAAVDVPLAFADIQETQQATEQVAEETQPTKKPKRAAIELIEVTATRRAQSIQSVPISVTALSCLLYTSPSPRDS